MMIQLQCSVTLMYFDGTCCCCMLVVFLSPEILSPPPRNSSICYGLFNNLDMFLFMLENNDVLDVTFVFFNKGISTTNIESYRKMKAMMANVLPQISRLWL